MKGFVVCVLLVALMFAVFLHATSEKVWYAGEHTAGCDGSQDAAVIKSSWRWTRRISKTPGTAKGNVI